MTESLVVARADATAVGVDSTGAVIAVTTPVITMIVGMTRADTTSVAAIVATLRLNTAVPETTPGESTTYRAGSAWFGHVESTRIIALRSAEVTQRWYFRLTAIWRDT